MEKSESFNRILLLLHFSLYPHLNSGFDTKYKIESFFSIFLKL